MHGKGVNEKENPKLFSASDMGVSRLISFCVYHQHKFFLQFLLCIYYTPSSIGSFHIYLYPGLNSAFYLRSLGYWVDGWVDGCIDGDRNDEMAGNVYDFKVGGGGLMGCMGSMGLSPPGLLSTRFDCLGHLDTGHRSLGIYIYTGICMSTTAYYSG